VAAAPKPAPDPARHGAALANDEGGPIYAARLRWRCRRGMLENDLVLERFLDRRGGVLSAAEAQALDRALDLPDGELWDLIAHRRECDDPALAPIIEALRAA
jgi:antitoxin CptB